MFLDVCFSSKFANRKYGTKSAKLSALENSLLCSEIIIRYNNNNNNLLIYSAL